MKELEKFKEFMETNREYIYSNTPTNNVISKDDEWRNETEWDELFDCIKS